MRPSILPILVLLPLLGLPAPSGAALHSVPGQYATVRAAAAAAASGDTVLLSAGVHPGGVWVNGKSLTFASTYALTGDTSAVAQTVLSGVQAGACGGAAGCVGNAVLEFGDAANGSAVIGLTVTGGENGIASGSTVDIVRCRVIGNGDGVDYVPGAGGTIRNSLFANNADDGIDLNGRMTVTILDNDIRDNADDGIEYRLYAYTGALRQVTIVGNRISGNGEDGIQIIDYPGAASYVIRIERNVFRSNFDASGLSAAIAIMPDGETIETLVGAPAVERIVVLNNTFISERNGIVGGANLIALNNLFTGITGTAIRRVGGNSVAAYSLFWGNGLDHEESVVDLPGNRSAAPQLDASGRPAPGSPAVDGGTAFYSWRGETVLAMPPTGYTGAAPDLGAFEQVANTAPFVSAGPPRTLTLSMDALEVPHGDILEDRDPARLRADTRLEGSVGDDGLPWPPTVTTMWSRVSGPAPVTFSSPARLNTLASFTSPGTYVLRLSASDGQLSGAGVVEITVLPPVNLPPSVQAGPDQIVTLPAQAGLTATVLDDGLPVPPGTLSLAWSQVSGPGAVLFEAPALPTTRVTFPVPGSYVLRLTADDGALATSDSLTVTVLATPNTPPLVEAGPDRTLTLSLDATEVPGSDLLDGREPAPLRADAQLEGAASDDGLPAPPALALLWTLVSGPAPVTFSSATRPNALVSFTAPGTYVLRLTASDGELSASDLVTFTIVSPVNRPPVVHAGPAQTITFPSPALLHGTVLDDGLPVPGGTVASTWSIVSGPAGAVIGSPSALETPVTFAAPGSYVLRLAANDGALSASSLTQITVLPPPQTFERRIAAGSDDAEESDNGKHVRNASDLDLVYESGSQTVGLRFTAVPVPPGATVLAAWVQFRADAVEGAMTSLRIEGQAADDPPTFSGARYDLSGRPRTAAFAAWSPPPWTTVGAEGPAQRTSDLTAVLQEIVNRPGWAGGNAVVLLVTGTGTGKRTARSQEIDPAGAALLHVEYTEPVAGGGAPTAEASPTAGTGEATGLPSAATREAATTGTVPEPGAALQAAASPAAPEPADAAGDPSGDGAAAFGLLRVGAAPGGGGLRVELALGDDGHASVELLDIAGRRVATRDLGAPGTGRLVVELRERLPAGVYLVRLTQGPRSAVRKAVVLE